MHAKSVSVRLFALSMAGQLLWGGNPLSDRFENGLGVQALQNLARRPVHPRIVTRPDVRINPADPAHYTHEGAPSGYGFFPYVLRLHNGDILTFYRECRAHVYDPSGRAVFSRSKDGGRTWEPPVPFYYRDRYTSGPNGVAQTSDGRLWVTVMAQFYDERKGSANDPRAWDEHCVVVTSSDSGATWKVVAEPGGGACPTPAIEMSNGRLLWLGSHVNERGDPVRATFLHTETEGRIAWEKRPHPELGPTSDEWSVVETRRPGELVAMLRNQQHSQFYGTSRSLDYGKTWAPWTSSNVFFGPFPTRPHLQAAGDGMLLFTYGQRWVGRTFAVASHDDGRTWDIANRQVILHSPKEYHAQWDSHYTDIARAEGDHWIAVDYIATPKPRSLRGIYGTFLEGRFFRGVREGLQLALEGAVLRTDTAGHWSFDDLVNETGDFTHDTVAGNFGAVHEAQPRDGRFGRALEFDGKDDHVMVYDDATLRLPKYFTVEAWIHTRDSSRDQTIVSKAPKYTLGIRGGRLALEIGGGAMVAESKSPLPSNQWVHVAAAFGMRRLYSRATFFINGQEDSWVSPKYGGGFTSYAKAALQNDQPIVKGELYQESGEPNRSTDNLVIGLDNDLKGHPFAGLIDEVAIHRRDLQPEEVAESFARRHVTRGFVRSRPIHRGDQGAWGTFQARTLQPEGTSIRLRVETPGGEVLLADLKDGADLVGLKARTIVLRADLLSERAGQTPALLQWSVGCRGCTAEYLSRPFPNQTAAPETAGGKDQKGGVVF